MSINHFSTELQETPCRWQHPQHPQQSIMEATTQNSSSSSHKIPQQQFSSWPISPHQFYHHQQFSHNPTLSFNEEQQMTNKEQEPEFAKEPMFEKPLTPSDVGKLNRLVIPKQHAEKYFPLGGGGDSGSEKGSLLSFEDESGKCWRFRYSYWNSSQSYVLTKGWSRYVKDKGLDAGDVILFERLRNDSERLFIGWRRRGDTAAHDAQSAGAAAGGGGGWPREGSFSNHPYPGVTVPLYQHAGSVVQSQTTSVGSSKTLRLFGVNLECQLDESEESELGQGQSHQLFNYSMEAYNSTNRHNHHMERTLSQEDVNQMIRNSNKNGE